MCTTVCGVATYGDATTGTFACCATRAARLAQALQITPVQRALLAIFFMAAPVTQLPTASALPATTETVSIYTVNFVSTHACSAQAQRQADLLAQFALEAIICQAEQRLAFSAWLTATPA